MINNFPAMLFNAGCSEVDTTCHARCQLMIESQSAFTFQSRLFNHCHPLATSGRVCGGHSLQNVRNFDLSNVFSLAVYPTIYWHHQMLANYSKLG